ncbi:hypothetical protein DV738_g491, partial [Chaetothyriales sp. CBS 135597]
MKVHTVGLMAALIGLGMAVPQGRGHGYNKHANLHNNKAYQEVRTHTTVVTSVIVETQPAAVVWVDEKGKVLYTEYKQAPTPTPIIPAVPINTEGPILSIPTAPVISIPAQPTPVANAAPAEAAPVEAAPVAAAPVEAAPVEAAPVAAAPVEAAPVAAAPVEAAPVEAAPVEAAPVESEAVTVPDFWPSDPAAGGDANNKSPQLPAAASGYGICYDMIHSGPCRDAAAIDRDMSILSNNGYKLVRTYDIGCDIGLLVKSAMKHGMMAFVGINVVSNVEADIRKLISYINAADAWAGVHTVNIGNEVIHNGGSAAAVVAAIGAAKPLLQQAGYTGNIVTVETHGGHMANPSLCEASSYCAVNAQPFFDPSLSASEAGDWVLDKFNTLRAQSGKEVVVTEAGWPYGGSSNGAAVASPNEQTTAINGIKQAFSDKPGNVYLFQGFDTLYKAPGPMGIEQRFGIFDH